MPLYKGDKFIPEIRQGDTEIRRVYKGDQLVFGKYDINYHDTDTYKPSIDDRTEYTWGLDYNITPISNSVLDNKYSEFINHWYGWYNDTQCKEKRDSKDDYYIIDKTEHSDIDLYAKWGQKRFTFSGTYKTEKVDTSGGGELPELPAIGTYYTDLPDSWYTENGGWYLGRNLSIYRNYGGQCTWGANGRTAQMRGSAKASAPEPGSFSAAYQWPDYLGGNWTFTADHTQVQVGDVVVWATAKVSYPTPSTKNDWCGDNGHHVAVVEEVIDRTAGKFRCSSWNHSNSGYKKKFASTNYSATQTPSSWAGVDIKGKEVVRGYVINHEDPVIGITYTIKSTEETPGKEEDCSDQHNPQEPSLPANSWWVSETKNTYNREYNYDTNKWNNWKLENNNTDWSVNWEE